MKNKDQCAVVLFALRNLIEQLNDPNSADRAHDASIADRQIEVATEVIADLESAVDVLGEPAAIVLALAVLIEQAYRSGDITERVDHFSAIVAKALGLTGQQMREAYVAAYPNTTGFWSDVVETSPQTEVEPPRG